MADNVFTKDPHAFLDWYFDWSDWLAEGETITDHTITVDGLVNELSLVTGGSVVVWLSSGSPGVRYPVACRITTSENRIDERTIKIDVKNR